MESIVDMLFLEGLYRWNWYDVPNLTLWVPDGCHEKSELRAASFILDRLDSLHRSVVLRLVEFPIIHIVQDIGVASRIIEGCPHLHVVQYSVSPVQGCEGVPPGYVRMELVRAGSGFFHPVLSIVHGLFPCPVSASGGPLPW